MSTYPAHRVHPIEPISLEQIRHRMFACSTFIAFNILFFLGVRPTLLWMTHPVQNSLSWLAVLASTLWLYQAWKQRSEHESRSHRRQYQLQVYQEVLNNALTMGSVESSGSLDLLHDLRQQLDLTSQDHGAILATLGIEDVDRLDPHQQRSQENQARLTDYQTALELMLLELVDSGMPLKQSLQLKYPQILTLQRNAQISDREHAQLLDHLLTDHRSLIQKAETLLTELQELTHRKNRHSSFQSTQNTQQIVTKLLSILEILGDDPTAHRIARRVSKLASHIIPGVLARADQNASWQARISPKVLAALRPCKLRHSRPVSSK
jgi:hypothetical protein